MQKHEMGKRKRNGGVETNASCDLLNSVMVKRRSKMLPYSIYKCTQCFSESIVSFGKYKGLKFHELPKEYAKFIESTEYAWIYYEALYHINGHNADDHPDERIKRWIGK